MDFIYNSRNRTIKGLHEDSANEIKLSELESKLVEVLSNGHEITWEDICRYIYKENSYTPNSIRVLKNHLLDKVNLNIVCTYGYGLTLKDKVYIR